VAAVCMPLAAAGECTWAAAGAAERIWVAADVTWAALAEVSRFAWAMAADAILSAEEVVAASGMDAGTPMASARAGAGLPVATFGFVADQQSLKKAPACRSGWGWGFTALGRGLQVPLRTIFILADGGWSSPPSHCRGSWGLSPHRRRNAAARLIRVHPSASNPRGAITAGHVLHVFAPVDQSNGVGFSDEIHDTVRMTFRSLRRSASWEKTHSSN
jgi:hypothetical protein